jgi:alpha-1,3-mannosyltransferase
VYVGEKVLAYQEAAALALGRGRVERVILGVPIQVSSRDDAVREFDAAIGGNTRLNVAFANANTLRLAHKAPDFRRALQSFRVLNDGLGVDIASRIKYGVPFPENLNGTDFLPHYLTNSRHELRIFLLGGRPAVVTDAAKVLQSRCPRHNVVGYRSGYFGDEATPSICEEIRSTEADLVLVALGNPLQELWIAKHGGHTGAKLLIGVGALFDFLSGQTLRAPSLIRWALCYWLFRLLL